MVVESAPSANDDRPEEGLDRVVFEAPSVDLEGLEALADQMAAAIRLGDLILLFGPLGAGKTTFVRMLAERLHVTDQVRSPSFTIANIYKGPMVVYHLDLYRLEDFAAEDVLALEEYVSPEVVTMVEWPEAGASRLGEPAWTVRLDHHDLETRSVRIEARDRELQTRWERASR